MSNRILVPVLEPVMTAATVGLIFSFIPGVTGGSGTTAPVNALQDSYGDYVFDSNGEYIVTTEGP